MARVAMDGMSWRGLIRREVGLPPSPPPFSSSISPSPWVPRPSATMCGAGGGLAAVLAPRSPPLWFARKARMRPGKDGVTWQDGSPLAPLAAWPTPARPPATTLGAAVFLGWYHRREGASKGEEDTLMDTCARRALTSAQTQSGAVNGNLPSASSRCPVSLLRWVGLTRQHGRGSIDGCSRLSDRSLTHTRGSPASRWRSFFCEW